MNSAAHFCTSRLSRTVGTIRTAFFALFVITTGSIPALCQSDITNVHIVDSMTRFWINRTGGQPLNPGYTGDPSYDRTLKDIDARLADMNRGGLGYPGGSGSAPSYSGQSEQFPIMFPSVGAGNSQLDREAGIGRYSSGSYGTPPSANAGPLRVTTVLNGLANVAMNYARAANQAGYRADAQNWAGWARFFNSSAGRMPANLLAQNWLPGNAAYWQTVAVNAHAQRQESIARFAATYAGFWADLDRQFRSGAPRINVRFPIMMAHTTP